MPGPIASIIGFAALGVHHQRPGSTRRLLSRLLASPSLRPLLGLNVLQQQAHVSMLHRVSVTNVDCISPISDRGKRMETFLRIPAHLFCWVLVGRMFPIRGAFAVR